MCIRDSAEGERDSAALPESVDSEARQTRMREGHIELARLTELLQLAREMPGQRLEDGVQLFRPQRRKAIERAELTISPDDRRLTQLEVKVGAPDLDYTGKEVVKFHPRLHRHFRASSLDPPSPFVDGFRAERQRQPGDGVLSAAPAAPVALRNRTLQSAGGYYSNASIDAPPRTGEAASSALSFPSRESRQTFTGRMALRGGVPERPKGAGCKPVGSAYGGSNPPSPIFSAES